MSALRRLAERLGIETAYDDAEGRRVTVRDDTLRRILALMGTEAPDDGAARRALAAVEAQDWSRPLPPVIVDRSGGADVQVDIVLDAEAGRLSIAVAVEGDVVRHQETLAEVLEEIGRSPDGTRRRRRLAISDLPLGYHRLTLAEPAAETLLIVAPPVAFLPEALAAGGRGTGLAVFLPLVRSARNAGIGDFADLVTLVRLAAERGADLVGLNPLHALFLDDPGPASPYSPASRLLLNPLFIALDAVPGADVDPAEAAALRAVPEVDYASVARLKRDALRRAHRAFAERADLQERRAFEAFVEGRGAGFRDACLFLALHERFAAEDPPRPRWQDWPPEVRDPAGVGARRFAAEAAEAVEFQLYMQWIADRQLAAAAAAAEAGGMAIGLYRDLAVGADSAGAETWADPRAVLRGATVGAPPDIFMPLGQDWGLPPFAPAALAAGGYAGFIELLRANMRHAGALRIDHVMALKHLWWVPAGSAPADGAYVTYPMDDLLGILCLESCRHRCLVVGEDLGTVPAGFRETMAAAGILSYRVLFFEQDFEGASFTPPGDWPRLSIAVAGSHDLPTLAGWWAGNDIAVKDRLGLYPQGGAADQHARRERERAGLLALMAAEGLGEPSDAAAFSAAAHALLARSRAALSLVQLDDITGETLQINVPGTGGEHPNWRRKYALPVEALAGHPGWTALVRSQPFTRSSPPSQKF